MTDVTVTPNRLLVVLGGNVYLPMVKLTLCATFVNRNYLVPNVYDEVCHEG